MWHISEQRLYKSLKGHADEIFSLQFAIQGRVIVSGGREGAVLVWDIANERAYITLSAGEGVTSVSVCPDQSYIAASCQDGSICIWCLHTQKLVEHLSGPDGHTNAAYCASFLSHSRVLISGGLDRTVKLWDLRSLGTDEKQSDSPTYQVKTLQGHEDFVVSICATPNSRWAISGSKDNSVRFWDASSGEPQFALHAHKNTVLSVSASDCYFATGGGDTIVRVWSYNSRAA